MISLPPEPKPGDRISANTIRELIRAIRAIAPVEGPGIKLSRGPNGTIFKAAVPKTNRNDEEQDLGCFYISSKSVEAGEDPEEDPSTISIEFGNPYYRCSGKTFESSADEISDVELPAIVALKVNVTGNLPSATLTSYPSLQDLSTAERDQNHVIHPLYQFSETGALVCDFRNILVSTMFEFANPA